MIAVENVSNVSDIEAAAVCARNGDVDGLFARVGADVDVVDHKGDSLLMLAAYHGQVKAVVELLRRGAKNGRSARGLSPFDGAAFKGDVAVVDAFLAAGVDVDEAGPDGRTPLMWAAAFNRTDVVVRLLAAGARRDVVDHAGRAAVDHAVAMGAGDAADLLRG